MSTKDTAAEKSVATTAERIESGNLRRLGRLELGITVAVPDVGDGEVVMISGTEDFVVIAVDGDDGEIHYTVPYVTALEWWTQSLPTTEGRDAEQ